LYALCRTLQAACNHRVTKDSSAFNRWDTLGRKAEVSNGLIRRTGMSAFSKFLRSAVCACTMVISVTSFADFDKDSFDPAEFAAAYGIPGMHKHHPGNKALREPLVIAHRGASGYVPEHTLAAYAIAIFQGADFVEPDLVATKDHQLIARHDNILDLTTDVADHPEFAARKTTKSLDGISVTGWFSEDFTLKEIKTLRAIERIPALRPENAKFNGMFEVPTLQEIIDLVQSLERATGRKIGIYPETKHPTYFDTLGLSLEEPLVKTLHKNGYRGKHAPIFIQSFEVANLKALRGMTELPLIQLFGGGKPFDVEASGGTLTYIQMAGAQGLKDIAKYAYGVGPEKTYIIPRDGKNELHIENKTAFVTDAHAAGLKVHPYTFRAENNFLPANLRTPDADPTKKGDLQTEIRIFLEAGIDGFFTDQTDVGVKAKAAWLDRSAQ
jgi:glycerophosphoryl diester phosphodiesterase